MRFVQQGRRKKRAGEIGVFRCRLRESIALMSPRFPPLSELLAAQQVRVVRGDVAVSENVGFGP